MPDQSETRSEKRGRSQRSMRLRGVNRAGFAGLRRALNVGRDARPGQTDWGVTGASQVIRFSSAKSQADFHYLVMGAPDLPAGLWHFLSDL